VPGRGAPACGGAGEDGAGEENRTLMTSLEGSGIAVRRAAAVQVRAGMSVTVNDRENR
jgi:hypothetical protein